MKNNILFTILVASMLSLVSCSDSDTNIKDIGMGDCDYHPAFLWSDEKYSYIDKHIILDFSEDAKNEQSEATLIFTDGDNRPLNMTQYEILIDGKALESPEIRVKATQDSVRLQMRALPSTESGTKIGYLNLKNSTNLDRIEQQELTNPNQSAQILQWHFEFHNNMNPLAKGLMWVAIVIVAALIVWFLILKRIFIRTFGSIRKTVYFENDAPVSLKFKGARLLVVDKTIHKQGFFDNIFFGKIKYVAIPSLRSAITFRPGGKSGIYVKANPADYSVRPNPMPKIGECIITDKQTNNNIRIL